MLLDLAKTSCIYAVFADSAECQSSFLVGKRHTCCFRDLVIPFVRNLFPPEVGSKSFGQWQKTASAVLAYARIMQERYFDELKKYGLTEKLSLPKKQIPISIDCLEGGHGVLSSICGQNNLDYGRVKKKLLSTASLDVQISNDDETELKEWLKIARDAYDRFEDIYDTHGHDTFHSLHTPLHTISQFMQFLSHFSTGVFHALAGEKEGVALSKKEIGRGIDHLIRVSLDMHKAVTVILIKSQKRVSPFIKDVIKVRQRETGPDRTQFKKTIDEYNTLFSKIMKSLEITQKNISTPH